MSSSNNEANGFTNAQFSRPNEKETKHKESKENFYASLRNDVVGVVITGLFIAAAVMIPSVAGAVVCGVVAVLVAVCRVKDALVESPIPGKVQISILSTQTGIVSEELLEIVRKQVTRDDIRVLTDTVTVIGCNITEIDIHSRISVNSQALLEIIETVKKQFIEKFELAKRLGRSVTSTPPTMLQIFLFLSIMSRRV